MFYTKEQLRETVNEQKETWVVLNAEEIIANIAFVTSN